MSALSVQFLRNQKFRDSSQDSTSLSRRTAGLGTWWCRGLFAGGSGGAGGDALYAEMMRCVHLGTLEVVEGGLCFGGVRGARDDAMCAGGDTLCATLYAGGCRG